MGGRFKGKWILLASIGVSIILIALFSAHYNSLIKNKENTILVNHTYEVLQSSDELLTNMVNAETGQRGFIITLNEEFLQPYYGSREKVNENLKHLKALTADNPSQQMRLDTLISLCTRRLDRLELGIGFGMNNKFNDARLLLNSGIGKRLMDSTRLVIANFKLTEERLLKERLTKAEETASSSFGTLLIGTIFIFSIVLALLIVLYREDMQRRKMEKELFLSREWFSKTLLSMGDGVIATDANGIVSFMNKAAQQLTGWNTLDATGKPLDFVFDIINEYTGQAVINPIKTALTENKIVLLANHTLLIRKDKTKIFIDDSAAPVHNEEGKIIGAVLIFRDVSEQSIARKKLAESEKRLQGIMNNTTAVIYTKDLDGRYLMINNQYEKIFGFKPADIIGKTDYDLFPAEISDKYTSADKSVIKTGQTIQVEEEGRHADGTIHTYVSSKFPLYNEEGKIIAVCGVSTDITESKKNIALQEKLATQNVLLKSELRYTELTDNMPNMFLAYDKNMHFIHWNKACERFSGINAENVIGKYVKEVFPEVVSDVPDNCMKVLKTKETLSYVSAFNFKGQEQVFQVNIYPTEQGVSVLMTNITQQKKAEKETLELVDSLQNKNKDLRQFAYIVSHNLRAPIAKIQGLASIIESEHNGGTLIGEVSLLETISEEASHLDDVVKDLNMIISTRDSGDNEIKETINFDDQLKLINQVLENEINDSGAKITSDFSALKSIISIKGYIYSIIYNLVSNAIKYRSPQRPLRIHLATGKNDEFSWLTVQDNGLGIDMKKNGEKIFGLYKRFHDHVGGKGIGLHLVKTQAESMGGRVEIESRLNEGTTFKIFFK